MVDLLKVHGSENTFFLLDQEQLDRPLTQDELIQMTMSITNRATGLLGGADGVLVVDAGTHADVLGRMQVINSDGSIASMCGNGLRTVSRYLSEKFNQDHFVVQTAETDLQVGRAESIGNDLSTYCVEISPVSFNADTLPMQLNERSELFNIQVPEFDEKIKFSAVSVPNPHLIAIDSGTKLLNSTNLEALGRRLNGPNPWFPDGVNVSFGRVVGQNQLFVQTYERGVGFTNACGTGMSAASLVWTLLNDGTTGTNTINTVFNPGGMVQTRVRQENGEYRIDLIGNATVTHRIEISDKHLRTGQFNQGRIFNTGEESQYQAFVNQLPHYSLV